MFIFQADISVHLPVTHFCMLHLILFGISFRFTKQHAFYVVITVNSSPCSVRIQFHIVPTSVATTTVFFCKGLLCCTVRSHRYFISTVQVIQINYFFTMILILKTCKIKSVTRFVGSIINKTVLMSFYAPSLRFFFSPNSLCVSL